MKKNKTTQQWIANRTKKINSSKAIVAPPEPEEEILCPCGGKLDIYGNCPKH